MGNHEELNRHPLGLGVISPDRGEPSPAGVGLGPFGVLVGLFTAVAFLLHVRRGVARPPARDPKRFRVFVVVSRQALIDSRFSTIICAPVYSTRHGLATQVDVGLNEGLRHDSSVHCDELVSLRKSQLTQFVGTFDTTKLKCLDDALMVALGLLRS